MTYSSRLERPNPLTPPPPVGGVKVPALDYFGSSKGSIGDKLLRMSATGSAWFILVMLAMLLIVLFVAAAPSIRRFGPQFLVETTWRPNSLPVLKLDAHGRPIRDHRTGMKVVDHNEPPKFGALDSLYGTAVTSVLALILAVPLSMGTALYLVRVAARWLIAPVSFLVEFLAAIPSIAYGLWGMFVVGPWLAGIETHIAAFAVHIPVVRWMFQQRINGQIVTLATNGRDIFCAGVVLGIMIIPIITAISRDVLKNVPLAQIEGTIALGATWWQSCREMLKYSRSALFGAVILGLARAAGETMAVLMVMGNSMVIPTSPFQAGTTMAATLAGEFPEASTNDLHRGALMEVALILLVMSLAFNIVARYLVVGKSARTSAAF